jgi:hypothetical protein
MDEIETMQVVHKYIPIPFVTINKCDFDSEIHTPYPVVEESVATKTTKKAAADPPPVAPVT